MENGPPRCISILIFIKFAIEVTFRSYFSWRESFVPDQRPFVAFQEWEGEKLLAFFKCISLSLTAALLQETASAGF